MVIFVNRAHEFLESAAPQQMSKTYRALVQHYLALVSEFLMARIDVSDAQKEFIPHQLRDSLLGAAADPLASRSGG